MRKISFLLAILAMTVAPSIAAEPVRILCLGDSLTEGFGLTKEEAWPAIVEKLLVDQGHQVTLLNAGVSGSTTASGLSRLRWQLKSKPQILILALGANDGLRGLDLAQTEKNLSQIIQMAQKNRMKVLLAGMKMPPNYGKYAHSFEAMYQNLSKTHNTAFAPFILEGVAADPSLNLPDGLHPNAEGYKKIAAYLLPYIEKLL